MTSIALSADERHSGNDSRVVRDLVEWAGFYRGMPQDYDRAGDLLTRAESIVGACCGTVSREMERVLQERAWLAVAIGGRRAAIPYLDQLRTLRTSIYGPGSQQVDQTRRDIAEAQSSQ